MKPIKILVYGSLRQGMQAHDLMKGCKYIQTLTIDAPYKMVDLGWYPGLVFDTENHQFIAEQYEIDNEELYHRLEHYEGYPSLYRKEQLPEGEIYVFNREVNPDLPHIEDWKKYYYDN